MWPAYRLPLSTRRAALAVTAASLALLAAPILSRAETEICTADAGQATLDFTLKDLDGNDVALSDYAGRVVLLDFWATWCGPCRIEIPEFVELYDTYQARGFVVLGISVDDPVEALRAYSKELGMNYPVLVGAGRDDVKDAFGPLIAFPTAVLIERDGKICRRHVGLTSKEQIEAEIRALL